MTSEHLNQVTVELMLFSLLGVLAIAVLMAFVVGAYLRKRRLTDQPLLAGAKSDRFDPRPHIIPHALENPCRWLAVRHSSVASVQAALGLNNAVRCTWGEGISMLEQRSLFVSPPVNGWIIVLGHGLPEPSEDVDECFHLITGLSRALGTVQYFSAHRALNHHAWARAEAGRVIRAYAWAGEALWNQGIPTQAEIDLRMKCFDYGEGPKGAAFHLAEAHQPNADKVFALASKWSIDPSTIGETVAAAGHGCAGDLSHPNFH